MSLPKIGLTLGDPGGIGPEIILRLLGNPENLPPAEIIIFGQRKILQAWAEKLGPPIQWLEESYQGRKIIIEESGNPLRDLTFGSPSAENGQVSFAFFRVAVDSARKGEIQALVTAPVSKTSWQLAGIKFRGHTEFLESLFPEAIMSFWSERLRLALFTHHLPLIEAVSRIKKEALLTFFISLEKNLNYWNFGVKELMVCGLNPHAGESGSIGQEEQQIIIPAVTEARDRGLNINGPFPSDTVFVQAVDHPEKMIVCLYHDQGLIPFKLLSFDSGVNLTLGLPFIRTSPDHGTAFDIAGKGKANLQSLKEALWLAWKVCQASNRA
jgi:4-hydroxythreonine-4-phosphate dehydrogenase